MNEHILVPYLLMDSSYQLTSNLFINNTTSVLREPRYKYYTIPYNKQISKYFRDIFNLGNEHLILDLMDIFDTYIENIIEELIKSIFDYFKELLPTFEDSELQIISELHANIALIKLSQEFHKRFIGKVSCKLQDLYAYNQNILKHLQRNIQIPIVLNNSPLIHKNVIELTNKCLNFKINHGDFKQTDQNNNQEFIEINGFLQ